MFELRWPEWALDNLAHYYIDSSPEERERMARDIEGLNQRLRNDPLDVGESREKGFRVAIVRPLTIGFHVDVSNRIVSIHSLRRFHSK